MAETDHTGLLGAVAAPALVIVGACDCVAPPQESRTIATSLPDARFEVIDGAGHLSNQERPDEVARLVIDFLGELEAREDLRVAAVPRSDASGAIPTEDREERW
jgi:pimeloyl-ACP methyl ester carboxylesterase